MQTYCMDFLVEIDFFQSLESTLIVTYYFIYLFRSSASDNFFGRKIEEKWILYFPELILAKEKVLYMFLGKKFS